MFSMVEIIQTKRDGLALSREQIEWFVQAYTRGAVPDYQAAALVMAIYLQGMTRRETIDLTLAMADSGDRLDLHDVVPFVVDKHSSGGVGDKTTLVILPLVASCGVPVGKMSGRGLGISGGTLDKMETFPGWSPDLSIERFKAQLGSIGSVLAGQTARLAPADGKLYALRDVTATIDNVSLIAASIMSKKLAGGADAIVLDVKVGKGAFMPTLEKARELARLMVDIGKDAGKKMVALISDMNQPLGYAVGNALEVREAIDTLNGDGPADFWDHCLEVSGHMLLLAGKASNLEEAKELATKARDEGKALANFRAMVVAQGGPAEMVDNPDLLPSAKYSKTLRATRDGYVTEINAGDIGLACLQCGAGRAVKGQTIDYTVGMVIKVKVGDHVTAGEKIATIHANNEPKLRQTEEGFWRAVGWSESPVKPLPHLHEIVQ